MTSDDDGINAAGGNNGNNELHINGGYIVVDAIGDGIDVNGSMKMTNGTVIVYGPIENFNGALDYDDVFEMSGGLLFASGSSRMAQAPSTQSTQHAIQMNFPSIQQAGTLVYLVDSNNETIAAFSPIKAYQNVVISSPDLQKDETYTLYLGGSSTGEMKDGRYTGAKAQGGTQVVSFTIVDSITWLNESGITTERTMGPFGGRIGPGNR